MESFYVYDHFIVLVAYFIGPVKKGPDYFSFQVDIFKHFLARAICLIGVPVICYMIIFAVHFKVLSKR